MLRRIGERLRTTAARHPGRATGLLAAVAVLCGALAAGMTDRLTLASSGPKGPALRIAVHGPPPPSSPAYQVALRTMRVQLDADPAVASVRSLRRDSSTLMLVGFSVGGHRRDAAIARLERNLDPGLLRLDFSGPAAEVRRARDDALDSLLPLLGALVVIALLCAATLGVRTAGPALLGAAAAAALAALLCELATGLTDVGWLALPGAAAGGTLIGLQLSGMARFGIGAGVLFWTALAAAAVFAASAALGVGYLTSFGAGAAAASLLALPAALVAIGAGEPSGEPAPVRSAPAAPWRALGAAIGWSRLMALAIALLALLLLAIVAVPALRLQVAAIGLREAPGIGAAELGIAAGAAALATLALAIAAGRRVGLALAATIAAAGPAAATAGLLVISFQDGRWEDPLAYSSSGAVQLGSVAPAVLLVAGLGAAQVVALAGTSRGMPAGQAGVRDALGRCGPAAALGCLAGTAAGVAASFGSPAFAKQFGLAAAAGLMLELLVVQALLAPALLRLTARAGRHQ